MTELNTYKKKKIKTRHVTKTTNKYNVPKSNRYSINTTFRKLIYTRTINLIKIFIINV